MRKVIKTSEVSLWIPHMLAHMFTLIMNRYIQHTHSKYMYRVTHSGRTLAILNIFLQCFLRWLHTDLVIFSNAYSVWRFDLHTKRIQLKSDDIFKYYITCLFRNCLSLSKYQKPNVTKKISTHKKNHIKFILCLSTNMLKIQLLKCSPIWNFHNPNMMPQIEYLMGFCPIIIKILYIIHLQAMYLGVFET